MVSAPFLYQIFHSEFRYDSILGDADVASSSLAGVNFLVVFCSFYFKEFALLLGLLTAWANQWNRWGF